MKCYEVVLKTQFSGLCKTAEEKVTDLVGPITILSWVLNVFSVKAVFQKTDGSTAHPSHSPNNASQASPR